MFLRLFEQAWQLQSMQGGHAHGENPTGSHAWQLLNLGSAFEVDICVLLPLSTPRLRNLS